jgi:hypothetical protein
LVAIIVLGVCAIVTRNSILEAFYITRLDRKNFTRALEAADALLRVGTIKSLDRLLQVYGESIATLNIDESQNEDGIDMLPWRVCEFTKFTRITVDEAFKEYDKSTMALAIACARASLGIVKHEPAVALPLLKRKINDYATEVHVRRLCVVLFGQLVIAHEADAVDFASVARSEDATTRFYLARTLDRIGPEAIDVLPVLIERLEDEEVSIRWEAASAVSNIGEAANAAVPALIRMLEDKNGDTRYWAVRALEGMHARGAPAVHILRKMAKDDEDENIRVDAAKALETIEAGIPDAGSVR